MKKKRWKITIMMLCVMCTCMLNGCSKGDDKKTDSKTTDKTEDKKENSVNDKEIIKVDTIPDLDYVYLLDSGGRVYTADKDAEDNKEQPKFKQIAEDVADIFATSAGLVLVMNNNEAYIDAYPKIYTDKELKKFDKKFYRIMLDGKIVKATNNTMPCANVQFLCENGELYELLNSEDAKDTNVKKVMEHVKNVENNGHNVAILDDSGSAYVYGYNIEENGLLGKSDATEKFSDKVTQVSKPYKVAENVKDIQVVSNSLSKELSIYVLNNDGELMIIGQSTNNTALLGVENNKVEKFKKLEEDVVSFSATLGDIVMEKKDGQILSKSLITADLKNTKMMDKVDQYIAPDYLKGVFLKDGTLYGCGTNANGYFGTGNTDDLKTPTKIAEDVKSVFFSGKSIFYVKNDGSLWVAGSNHLGCLGMDKSKEIISEFVQVSYE